MTPPALAVPSTTAALAIPSTYFVALFTFYAVLVLAVLALVLGSAAVALALPGTETVGKTQLALLVGALLGAYALLRAGVGTVGLTATVPTVPPPRPLSLVGIVPFWYVARYAGLDKRNSLRWVGLGFVGVTCYDGALWLVSALLG